MTAPELSHVTTWLFDLDNTLYPLESGLSRAVDERLTAYIAALTGLPTDAAFALQKRYLDTHGLTLRGLMLHHGVDADAFHAHFHDLPLDMLAEDPALARGLARLPGRRIIFTNADDVHAARVLDKLRISHLFDGVFHLLSAGLEPKPSSLAFERLLAAHDIDPSRSAFFDDRAVNLEPAAALGMATILVGPTARAPAPSYVQHLAPTLAPFLAAIPLRETA